LKVKALLMDDMEDRDLLQAGFRYAFSLTHQHHDAEDLVQEAWIRLSRLYGNVANKSLFFVTIRNLFIDQYRRKNLVLIDTLEPINEPAADDDLLQLTLTADDIEQAMGSLRAEEREVIFLNIVEGYTAREIAELTQRSRNTILSLLHRGKKKLVNELQNELTGESYLAN